MLAHSLLGTAFFVLDLLRIRTACQVALPVTLRAILGPLRLYPVLIQENAISETLQIPDDGGKQNSVALGRKTWLCPDLAALRLDAIPGADYPGGRSGAGDGRRRMLLWHSALDAADLKKIKIPIICHFANNDDWCTPAKVNELETSLKQSKSQFEIYRYDAHHAFMNEARPEVYDAACAKTAWERTLQFLKKALT